MAFHELLDWPMVVDESAKLRLITISDETGRDIYDLMRTSVEEAALNYFRSRKDDPASTEKSE